MKEKNQSASKSPSYKGAAAKKSAAMKSAPALRNPIKGHNFEVRKMRDETKYLEVKKAEYVKENILLIWFNDGVRKRVDFSNFLHRTTIPYLKKYQSPDLFKQFQIEDGNLVWGKNWDLIFPIEQLYQGRIKL